MYINDKIKAKKFADEHGLLLIAFLHYKDTKTFLTKGVDPPDFREKLNNYCWLNDIELPRVPINLILPNIEIDDFIRGFEILIEDIEEYVKLAPVIEYDDEIEPADQFGHYVAQSVLKGFELSYYNTKIKGYANMEVYSSYIKDTIDKLKEI